MYCGSVLKSCAFAQTIDSLFLVLFLFHSSLSFFLCVSGVATMQDLIRRRQVLILRAMAVAR
jgi:hypothetical protein